jgi:hypothetical protein
MSRIATFVSDCRLLWHMDAATVADGNCMTFFDVQEDNVQNELTTGQRRECHRK